MSYIKSALIIDGIGKIVEVHGATWLYLDVQRYARNYSQHYRKLARELPNDQQSLREFYLKTSAEYAGYSKAPMTFNSGLARDIWQRGLSPITNSNKGKWVSFLLEEDSPGGADNSEEPPAVLVDFDSNKFYDTDRNFYARYEESLPEGWTYRRITPNKMADMLETSLPQEDRPRLGTISE